MPRVSPREWLEQVASDAGPKPAPVRHLCHVLAGYMLKDDSCYPSSRTLARDTGMSRNTVDRYLDQAVAAGWLEREERPAAADGRGWKGWTYFPSVPERGSTGAPPSLHIEPRRPRKRGAYGGPPSGSTGEPASPPDVAQKVAQKVAQSGPEGGSTCGPEVTPETPKTPEASLPQASQEIQNTPPSNGRRAGRRGGFTPRQLREAIRVLRTVCLLGRDRGRDAQRFVITLADVRDQWIDLAKLVGPAEATGIVELLRTLPMGHEDRPPDRQVISLRWILKASPGRLERLRAELRRRGEPVTPRSLDGLTPIGESVDRLLERAGRMTTRTRGFRGHD